MNVEQALNAAEESEQEGLLGLYPTAAQVLAAEVRDMRENLERQTKIAREQTDYSIALQHAIEAHCRDEDVPGSVDNECPHHAAKLDACLSRHNAMYTEKPAT